MKNTNIGLASPLLSPGIDHKHHFRIHVNLWYGLFPAVEDCVVTQPHPGRQKQFLPSIFISWLPAVLISVRSLQSAPAWYRGSSHQMSPNVSLNPLQLITVYYLMMINISIAVFTDALDCYPWMVAGVTVSLKPITSLSPIDLPSMPQ